MSQNVYSSSSSSSNGGGNNNNNNNTNRARASVAEASLGVAKPFDIDQLLTQIQERYNGNTNTSGDSVHEARARSALVSGPVAATAAPASGLNSTDGTAAVPANELPVATHKIEAKALRYKTVVWKQKEKGIEYDHMIKTNLTLALGALKKDRAHCFAPKASHVCAGSTDAHWKLQEMQKQRSVWGKKAINKSLWSSQEEARLIKSSNTGCTFFRIEEDQPFYHLHDNRHYRATGDVYLCVNSGKAHVCTAQECDHQITVPGGEEVQCSLTHKSFGQPMVNFEENTRGDERGRDGNMSYTVARAKNGFMVTSSNLYSNSGQQHKKRKQAGRDQNQTNPDEQHRNSNPDSCLIRVEGESRPLVEYHLSSLYPLTKAPIPTQQNRASVEELCITLIYDKHVRSALIDKLKEAEQQADVQIKSYYKSCQERKKRRNLFKVMGILAKHVKPCHDRLQTIGFFDRPVQHSVVTYFQEAILCVWYLLHYTPHAKRFQSGFQIKKYAPGILYKLQTGFYVSVLYDIAARTIISFNRADASSMDTVGDEGGSTTNNSVAVRNDAEEAVKSAPTKRKNPSLFEIQGTEDLHLRSRDIGSSTLPKDASAPPATVARRVICFLPRHKYLECIPQKNDLNKYNVFKNAEINSNQVVEGEKLICDCYESLLRLGMSIDRILDFTLERYINVRDVA